MDYTYTYMVNIYKKCIMKEMSSQVLQKQMCRSVKKDKEKLYAGLANVSISLIFSQFVYNQNAIKYKKTQKCSIHKKKNNFGLSYPGGIDFLLLCKTFWCNVKNANSFPFTLIELVTQVFYDIEKYLQYFKSFLITWYTQMW